MTFASLPAPRKLSTLEAAVSGGAFLMNPGLVAVVTTGPVRLAVLPMAGGPAAVADLSSLASASEIALLSKNVAVVRSTDETVWAVLDLASAPRVREAARDARSLRMRPSGESALALAADGSVTALLLNRDEVGARTFRLRTAVRACDLGESETYAVVDSDVGVEFRVHPGSTPESSASARIALPSDAVGLDRLRGSRDLSVLYKRGSPTLCVITGAAGKLEAKLVQIEAPPFDIAVLDGCIFVAFADGRVALYVPDAIARAGDAAVSAKSILTLAAAGKPRAILATTKGSPALWIGTSTGEVLGLTLARDAPRDAPKTVPPAPIEPRKDERAASLVELNRVKEELAAARADLAVKLDEVAAARQAETDRLRDAQLSAEAAHAEALRESVEERARALSAAAEEAQRERDAAISAEREEAAKALAAAISVEREEAAKALAAAVSAEREEAAKALATALSGAQREGERALAAALLAERQEAVKALVAELEESGAAHRAKIDQLVGDHTAALNALHNEERARAAAEERAAAVELELGIRAAAIDEAKEKLDAGDRRLQSQIEERDGLAADLASRTKERDGIQGELAEAQRRANSAEEKRATLEAELVERTRDRDIERSVAERLAAELEETRAKSGGGRPSIEHARDMLGSLVSQVREAFLKRPRD